MKTLYFGTTNKEKLQVAQAICVKHDIPLQHVALDIDEIQGEDPEVIIRDKAARAFEQLGMPVVVSDDSWEIHALNGFPGAYMKSMNYWFTADDFLRLMQGIKDRRATLHQYLAFTDGNVTEIFENHVTGHITHQAQGANNRAPFSMVVSFDTDNGKTLAEFFAEDAQSSSLQDLDDVWHNLIRWYQAEQK